MKIGDLARVQALAGELAATRRTKARLMDGELLTLMLGEGAEATRFDLKAAYTAKLRGALLADFAAAEAGLVEALAALGVEP